MSLGTFIHAVHIQRENGGHARFMLFGSEELIAFCCDKEGSCYIEPTVSIFSFKLESKTVLSCVQFKLLDNA